MKIAETKLTVKVIRGYLCLKKLRYHRRAAIVSQIEHVFVEKNWIFGYVICVYYLPQS